MRVGQARKLVELIRIDSAGRNAKAHRDKSRLFLRAHTKMVRVLGPAHVSALKRQLVAEARHKFGAQAAQAPLLNQKSKSALRTRFARAVVAVNFDQLDHHGRCLKDFNKDIQGRSDGESSGAHLPAYQHVEAKPPSFVRGNERDVLGLTMRAIVRATRHHDVEFARQVAEFRIALVADDDAIEFVDNGRSVKPFVRRQARHGAAVDVANIINARLERAQVHAAELLEDFRNAVEGETAQLNLLPCGDIQHAVAKPPRELRDGVQLFAPRKAVGHADAHHEFAGRRFAEKHADPLQQFLFGRRERFGATLDDLRKVFPDAQAVAVHRGFVAFYGVNAGGDLFDRWRCHLVTRDEHGECCHFPSAGGQRKICVASIKILKNCRKVSTP